MAECAESGRCSKPNVVPLATRDNKTCLQERVKSLNVGGRKLTEQQTLRNAYLELLSGLLALRHPLLSLLFRGLLRFLLAPARERALLPRELALQVRGARARALCLRQAVGGLCACLGGMDQPLVLRLGGLQPVKRFSRVL